MARNSVIMLCLAFFTFDTQVKHAKAADCLTYISGGTLLLPENTVCDLDSDIDATDVQILGQAISSHDSDVQVTITCTNFAVEAGGMVSLAGKGHGSGQGPGAGNAGGSGGTKYLIYMRN